MAGVATILPLYKAPVPFAALLGVICKDMPTSIVFWGHTEALNSIGRLRDVVPTTRAVVFQPNATSGIQSLLDEAASIDLVIAETVQTAETLQRRSFPPSKVKTIGSRVDVVRLAGRTRVTGGNRVPRVAFIGRWDRTKNPYGFIDAVAHLGNAGAQFFIIGSGRPRWRWRVFWRRLRTGLLLRMAVPGRLSDGELQSFMDGLDVLVVPSLVDGRPLVIQEARARGIAVVASRVGGIPELIVDGQTGLLCPPGDVDALGSAIQRLIADPELRQRLGAAAKSAALAEGGLSDILPEYARAILGH